MTRSITALVVAAIVTGCAADPPAAVVAIEARGCSPHPAVGTGTFVRVPGTDEPLVLTSAHVVRGADEITITRRGATGTGTVVAFDPEMDVAYVTVEGFDAARPWTVDSDSVAGGERGTAYVVRDGEVVPMRVTVIRRVQIRTEDVYLEGETHRPGYQLDADIDAGDSGGAVVVDGKVIGVLWARSRRDDDRAYAIDPVRAGLLVRTQLRSGDLGGVDLARCD